MLSAESTSLEYRGMIFVIRMKWPMSLTNLLKSGCTVISLNLLDIRNIHGYFSAAILRRSSLANIDYKDRLQRLSNGHLL